MMEGVRSMRYEVFLRYILLSIHPISPEVGTGKGSTLCPAVHAPTRIEAFYMTILPWGAGPNILGCYVLLFQPGLDFFASELRAIGASQVFGLLPLHSCAPVPIDDPMGACNQHEDAFPGGTSFMSVAYPGARYLHPIGTDLCVKPVEMC